MLVTYHNTCVLMAENAPDVSIMGKMNNETISTNQ